VDPVDRGEVEIAGAISRSGMAIAIARTRAGLVCRARKICVLMANFLVARATCVKTPAAAYPQIVGHLSIRDGLICGIPRPLL
jgi:hypothetical protein